MKTCPNSNCKNKTVWLICENAGSPRHGMNYRPYYLGRALNDLGFDVTVISGSTSHEFYSPPKVKGLYTIEDIDGLRYVWVRTPRYSESRSMGRIFAWLCYLMALPGLCHLDLPRPSSIIVSSPPPFPILVATRLARRFGSRLIFEERDLWPLSLIEVGGFSPRHPLIRVMQAIEDYAISRADVVVSVAPAAHEHFVSRGLPSDRLVVIPNGAIMPSEDKPEPTPAEYVRKTFAGRPFVIGYAGKLGASNAMEAFIRAAGLLSAREDIGFAILGEGSEEPRLRELASTICTSRNLLFFPRVPKENVANFLAAVDVCWAGIKDSSLYKNGISLTKLFDYMIAAKPIILSSHAGNDPVTEAGCGLTVAPEDPRALAAAIELLAGLSREELEAMGRAGRTFFSANHDWRILGRKYAEALGV